MARCIVGPAKTANIETLPEDPREGAARGVLRAARRIAVERHTHPSPTHLAAVAGEILRDARTN